MESDNHLFDLFSTLGGGGVQLLKPTLSPNNKIDFGKLTSGLSFKRGIKVRGASNKF